VVSILCGGRIGRMRKLLKRWWFWAGIGFCLVAIVVGSFLIPFGDGRISQAACDRIEIGWTLCIRALWP
jgi:hypothetical protein